MNRRQWMAGMALSLLAVAGGLSCDKSDGTASTTQPGGAGGAAGAGGKKLVVGFSQVGAESAWRTANTESVKSTAEKRGIDLRFSDAQQKQENQIKAIQSFITQGVDVIAFAPVVSTGWDPVLREAKRAGIPVVLQDRMITTDDASLFASFVGTDSVNEGRLAGVEMVRLTNGKANIAELEGTPGSDPAKNRHDGFMEVIDKHPDMHVIKRQTGDFTAAKGREVMESWLNSSDGEKINAVFAHNDDMALGAIEAIKLKKRKPGTDIKIVSIDGVKGAFQAMVDGNLNVSVECSPLLGPALFNVVQKVANGEKVEKRVINPAQVFTEQTAGTELPNRVY